MQIYTFTPEFWKDFELLDVGKGEKLESWGKMVIRRPEPQAVWDKLWTDEQWDKQTQISYKSKSAHAGIWLKKNNQLPDKWRINYQSKLLRLSFQLSLTAFKHIGLFPEQADNWEFIAETCQKIPHAKVLNLFAYTGGATLAAAQQGANVTHLDAIKQVVSWAKENAAINKIDNIRWIVDDALKFIKREISRGQKYHGILLDPPAFGHGTQGELWKLAEHINELMQLTAQLLLPPPHFVLLNVYSLGFSPIILSNLMNAHFAVNSENLKIGELYLPIRAAKPYSLPLGVVARYYQP
ncbi:MAG: class I SAM-dependent methyltransferase [Bacteroidia bacterium]|nr:class I SAM-dependent methyltransferase [Bacteroidia bacterium]